MCVAGQSSDLVTVQTIVDGPSVRVSTQGGPIRLLDARMPTSWTLEEVEDALERHRQRSGPLVAYVAASVAAQWERIRGELNRIAGGQASDRVMALAHYAEQANYAVDLQRKRLEVAVGEEAKSADSAVRDFTGLTAVAAARLNEAFDLAEREAKSTNPVTGLMARLGHGHRADPRVGPEVHLGVPVEGPGVVTKGAPGEVFPASPLGFPPVPPEPGDCK